MKKTLILKDLVKMTGKQRLWTTFSRYVLILNNYQKGFPLSRIENKNHKDNGARIFYLKLLADILDITVDYNSPLFEDRLSDKEGTFFWSDSDMYLRFDKRIKFLISKNIELNHENIKECLNQGSLLFNKKYNFGNE